MILKVKSIFPAEKDLSVKESWRFFENVQELHYTIYENGEKLLELASKWGTPTDVQSFYYRSESPAITPMLFASFHSEVLGPVHLFCDSTCYLLNDNGKTIERLI